MGKTLSSNTKVYINGYDISGDGSSVEPNLSPDVLDHTTFVDTGRKRFRGIHDDQFTYEGFFDDAAGQEDVIMEYLRGVSQSSDMLSCYPNTDALGQRGIAGILDMSMLSHPTKIAEMLTVKASFGLEGGAEKIQSLGAKQTVTDDGQGSVLDGLASSANGAIGYLQLFDINAGGVIGISIQHADTNWGSPATLMDLIVAGATRGATRVTVTGSVKRYVRVVWAGTGLSSATFQAGFNRL